MAAIYSEWSTIQLDRPFFWIGLVFALLALAFIGSSIRDWYRVRHIKGPLFASFSKLWLIRGHINQTIYLDLGEVCEKYGSIARIAPNWLVTSEPELLRRMWGVRSRYRRSEGYVGVQLIPGHDNVLSAIDENYHDKLRAKLATGYAGKENDHVEKTINEAVMAFVKLINDKYVAESTEFKPMDMGRKAQYFTLDAISILAYGRSFGDLESDSDNFKHIQTIEEIGPTLILITVLPWITKLFRLPILKQLLPSARDTIGFGKVMGVAKELVAERFGPNKVVKRDMLQSFIAHGLSQEEAESEVLVQILAGSDTSATAIRVTLLYIVTNPRVLSKFLNEILITKPSSPISEVEAKNMPYLQAIIKEGLRLWSPVTGLMAKVAPPEGDSFNGIYIPGGTLIGYSAWGVFRNKKFWGADANEFRPERWIENTPERLKDMESTNLLIFGYGRFGCLGKNVAMLELNKIFVELLRRFEFTIIDPINPCKLMSFGLFSHSEMWMRVSRREKQL